MYMRTFFKLRYYLICKLFLWIDYFISDFPLFLLCTYLFHIFDSFCCLLVFESFRINVANFKLLYVDSFVSLSVCLIFYNDTYI